MFRIIIIAVIAIFGWTWLTSPDKPRPQAAAPLQASSAPSSSAPAAAKAAEQEPPFLDSLKRTAGNVVDAGKATAVVARKAVDVTGKAAEGVKETAKKMGPYVDQAGEAVKGWRPAILGGAAEGWRPSGGDRGRYAQAEPGSYGWRERELRCGEPDSLGNLKYCFHGDK